jgi:uncharacterized protein (UPF0333 family)
MKNSQGMSLVSLLLLLLSVIVFALVLIFSYNNIMSKDRAYTLQRYANTLTSAISSVQIAAKTNSDKASVSIPVNKNANITLIQLAQYDINSENSCPKTPSGENTEFSFINDIGITLRGLSQRVDERYFMFGYKLPNPNTKGCYIVYDSLAVPSCTVKVVNTDC